jgi:hypothetical protein
MESVAHDSSFSVPLRINIVISVAFGVTDDTKIAADHIGTEIEILDSIREILLVANCWNTSYLLGSTLTVSFGSTSSAYGLPYGEEHIRRILVRIGRC